MQGWHLATGGLEARQSTPGSQHPSSTAGAWCQPTRPHLSALPAAWAMFQRGRGRREGDGFLLQTWAVCYGQATR